MVRMEGSLYHDRAASSQEDEVLHTARTHQPEELVERAGPDCWARYWSPGQLCDGMNKASRLA